MSLLPGLYFSSGHFFATSGAIQQRPFPWVPTVVDVWCIDEWGISKWRENAKSHSLSVGVPSARSLLETRMFSGFTSRW